MRGKILCCLVAVFALNAYAGKGMLRISTEPAEAKIFVDGKRKGSSPSQKGQYFAVKLSEGEYTITAKKQSKKDGYGGTYSGEKKVFVGEDTLQTITLKLGNFTLFEDEKKRKIADEEQARKLMPITDTYRSNPIRSKDFVPQGDGTVLDKRTGLTWMRCNLGQRWNGSTCSGKAKKYKWEEAKNACGSYAGKNDWRLPSLWELETLVYCSSREDKGRNDKGFLKSCKGKYAKPTLVQKAFPNSHDWTWSSTTDASDTSAAWDVYFYYGNDDWGTKSYPRSVRCVR